MLGGLQSLGEEVNEREVIDETVGEIQRPASEKQAVFRKRSRKRKRWGGAPRKKAPQIHHTLCRTIKTSIYQGLQPLPLTQLRSPWQ